MRQQVLGVGPALVLFADQVVGRHLDVVKPHLVDLMFTVHRDDGPHGDAGAVHVDQQKADAGLRFAVSAGAHQAEDPVAKLAQRGPGFLAIDDELVAVSNGAGLERGQVRTRARLAVALAPPHLTTGDAGQKALLLLRGAKRHDHRGHHHRAKRQDAWRAGQGALFFKQVFLHRGPARATKLGGPAVAQPAFGAQDLAPALHVVTAQAQSIEHFVADVLGQALGHPLPDFGAEGQFFRGEVQIHGVEVSRQAGMCSRCF